MELVTREELDQIIGLSETLPETYREKCFELLLTNLLQERNILRSPGADSTAPTRLERHNGHNEPQTLPIDVKAFFNQHHLELEILDRLFHIEGTEVRPIFSLRDTTKVKAEIHLALLLALETAIHNGQFQIDTQTLRKRCQEQKCYDMANFMRHIRNNAGLFRTIDPSQPLELSAEGKKQLAELVQRMNS
jgi:hypothetical protein